MAGDAFDERKSSHEAKYKMDEELRFKTRARSHKLLGLWAAGRMGHSDAVAAEYARELVMAGMSAPDDKPVVARVAADLAARGIGEADVLAEIARARETAAVQIAAEFPRALDKDHRQIGG